MPSPVQFEEANQFCPIRPQPRCHAIIDGLRTLKKLVSEVLEQDQKIYQIAEKLHKVGVFQ